MDVNLLEHTFSKPLKEYLNFANYNLSRFCEQIWKRNNLILNALSVLGRFKAYDILLPFNVLVKSYFEAEYLEWWNNVIEELDNSNEIHNLTNNLYKKLINTKKQDFLGSSRVMVGKKYPQPQCLC